jgi:dTDP-4-dehydrorhamnose 3,5-epimerase
VPRGFAHGFVVLSDDTIFQYKCDNYYAPQSEGAIAYNDPALGIDWQIDEAHVQLSEKDKQNPLLKDVEWLFDYEEELY